MGEKKFPRTLKHRTLTPLIFSMEKQFYQSRVKLKLVLLQFTNTKPHQIESKIITPIHLIVTLNQYFVCLLKRKNRHKFAIDDIYCLNVCMNFRSAHVIGMKAQTFFSFILFIFILNIKLQFMRIIWERKFEWDTVIEKKKHTTQQTVVNNVTRRNFLFGVARI